MSGLRVRLRDASKDAFQTVDNWNNRTNGWLLPVFAIPMLLSFKAVAALTTQEEQAQNYADNRENDLLFLAREKLMYNPQYYIRTDEYRAKNLPQSFSGRVADYSLDETMDYLESNFSKAWGSALIYGNREGNLTFISHYAIRKVGDRNDPQALRETLQELMDRPETFGQEIHPQDRISIEDVLQNIETINVDREAKIRKLAYSTISKYAYAHTGQDYATVKEQMVARANDWELNSYDITQEEILDYAIDHADELIDEGFEGIGSQSRARTKNVMAAYRSQRDSVHPAQNPTCEI